MIELRSVWPKYCGLIAVTDQKHAKAIEQYLRSHHRDIKTLIAISDEREAQDNLELFKTGAYHILITVAMCHIGYDYKPITVVCCLSAIREEGWLRQLFARAMRVIQTGDLDIDEAQRAYLIVPDDPKMQQIVAMLRSESEQGVIEKQAATVLDNVDIQRKEPEILLINNIDEIDTRAVGMEEENDVSTAEFHELEELRKRHKIGPVPLTALKALMRDLGNPLTSPTPNTPKASNTPLVRTALDVENRWRSQIKRHCNQCDKLLGAPDHIDWGYTYTQIEQFLGHKMAGEADYRAVVHWLEQTWIPHCKAHAAKQHKAQYHA